LEGAGERSRHGDLLGAGRFWVRNTVGARTLFILHTHLYCPWGSNILLHDGYRGSFQGQRGRGVALTTFPNLAPKIWMNEWIYTPTVCRYELLRT